MTTTNVVQFTIGNCPNPDFPRGTSTPEPHTTNLEALWAAFAEVKPLDRKESGKWICCATDFKEGFHPHKKDRKGNRRRGKYRLKSRAVAAQLMFFDFDGSDNAGVEDSRIEGWLSELTTRDISWVSYTSFSHDAKSKPGHSRCRIGIKPDREIKPEEWPTVWAYWQDFFDHEVDTAPRHIAAIYYTPSYPSSIPADQTRAWSRQWIGGGFSVDGILHSGAPFTINTKKTKGAPRTGSKTVAAPAIVDRLTWDTVIVDAAGNSHRLGDLRVGDHIPCLSPFRTEKTPSAFAHCYAPGKVMVSDSGSGLKQWVGGFDFSGAPFTIKTEEQKGAPEKKYLSDTLAPIQDLLPHGGLLVLDVGLGAGKTVYCAQQAKSMETVSVITDQVSLTTALAKQFGCALYTDKNLGPEPERLATTVHSLPRFSPFRSDLEREGLTLVKPTWAWELCISDEAPGIRASLHDSTRKPWGSQQTKEAWLAHLCNSKWAIVSSADLTPDEIEWLENAWKARRKGPGSEIKKVHQASEAGQRVLDLYTGSTWEARLLEEIKTLEWKPGDPPIVIQATDREYPDQLARTIARLRPDLPVWWISSLNSRQKKVKEALSDPDQILREHAIVIASPSIKAGLSWTLPVKKVYARFTAGVSARDLGQMILRVRNPIDTTIDLMFPRRTGEWQCDTDYLRKVALGIEEKASKEVDRTAIQWTYRGAERTPLDPELLESWVLTERERRINANDSHAAFSEVCKRHGWAVRDLTEDTVTDEVKAEVNAEKAISKEEAKQAHESAILEALDLTAAEYEDLADQHTVTAEEQAAVARYELEDFYQKTATPELIEYDRKGKTRKSIRDYVRVTEYQSGNRDLLAAQDLKKTAGDKHQVLRVPLLSEIATLILGSNLPDSEGLTLTKEDLAARVGPWLSDKTNRWKVREILGSSCTSATAENPTQWACGFLRKLGAEIQVTNPRMEDGARQRHYTISWEKVSDHSGPERTRQLTYLQKMSRPPVEVLEALVG